MFDIVPFPEKVLGASKVTENYYLTSLNLCTDCYNGVIMW